VTPEDQEWVLEFMDIRWGAIRMVSRGQMYLPHELPGFIAEREGEKVGLLTYHVEDNACEIVTVDSVETGQGIGTRLLEAIKKKARDAGYRRLWVITTNDNLDALAFYQKRGFILVALHCDALSLSRRLKPEIPLVGKYGIPLRDEIELELNPL
jgi:N-acetylglutamate synthase-like GNAT family acetyltransferase